MSTGPNGTAHDPAVDDNKRMLELAAPAREDERTNATLDAHAIACRERDEYRDRLLRKTAEFDNYRKRIERERRAEAAAAVVELLESLLPIVDDFERALAMAADDAPEAYRAGIELIHRQLLDLLAQNRVSAIDALGADFDPRVHEAVVTEQTSDRRDGEVMEELRRGYRIGDRLLRPAMVKVARA